MPTSNSVANVINFDVGTNDLKFFSNSAGTEIVLDEYVEVINPSFNVFDATPGEEGWLYNADPYSKVATMVKKFCIPVNMYATKAWTTAAHVDSIWTSYYTYYFAVMAILPGGGADAMGVALASQIAFRDA